MTEIISLDWMFECIERYEEKGKYTSEIEFESWRDEEDRCIEMDCVYGYGDVYGCGCEDGFDWWDQDNYLFTDWEMCLMLG